MDVYITAPNDEDNGVGMGTKMTREDLMQKNQIF